MMSSLSVEEPQLDDAVDAERDEDDRDEGEEDPHARRGGEEHVHRHEAEAEEARWGRAVDGGRHTTQSRSVQAHTARGVR